MESDLSALKMHGYFDGRWSCGRTKRIKAGDRIFLLRQGREPRGITASGHATSRTPYEGKHWNPTSKGKSMYVDVRFESLLDPEQDGALPLSSLQSGPLAKVHWGTQSSGISVPPSAALQLDALWRRFLENHGQSPTAIPEEISTPSLYFEGACRSITVNVYERDPRARKACIQHYGTTCFVCSFDFSATYGSLGDGFIHVHHLVPLSQINEGYNVDPIRDLRPVCPNCHAMLHKREKVLTIDELKKTLHIS